MESFIQSFLPNLAATVVGVILGLPVAVFVNRKLTEQQRVQSADAELARRNAAIDVLASACVYNIEVFKSIQAHCLEGRVMRNPDLRITTWDAVGPQFAPLCADAELLQIISHHWLRLKRLESLNDEIFAREVGTLPRFKDKEMLPKMWGELFENAQNLAHHASDIAASLRTLKKTTNGRVAVKSEPERFAVAGPESVTTQA